jgi:hypothetical protein
MAVTVRILIELFLAQQSTLGSPAAATERAERAADGDAADR